MSEYIPSMATFTSPTEVMASSVVMLAEGSLSRKLSVHDASMRVIMVTMKYIFFISRQFVRFKNLFPVRKNTSSVVGY